MKKIIAVCDRDAEYAHCLMEYMNRKKSFLMKAEAFSRESSIEEYALHSKISFLLLSEDMVNEKTEGVKSEKRIVLRKNSGDEEENVYGGIYKYQSAENILKEVMSLYEAEKTACGKTTVSAKKKRVIGVYTPYPCAEKTAFALTLGQIIAEDRAAIYINIESFSALEEIAGSKCENGLGELIYYAGQAGADAVSKLGSATVSLREFDIVAGARSPDDIAETDASKLISLFSDILVECSYEIMVLDFGNEVCGLETILKFCTAVYIPVPAEPFAGARLRDFEDYVREREIDGKKLRKVRLPSFEAAEIGKESCEKLAAGVLGDFVRELIKKEENIV